MWYQNGNPDPLKPILGSYSCIVNPTKVTDNFYSYMKDIGRSKPELAKAYFTALGRERYSMYKTNNNPETLKKDFGISN